MAQKFEVACNCPTPLDANPWRCVADDADQARERFFRRNGINGTDHEVTVKVIGEAQPEQQSAEAKQADKKKGAKQNESQPAPDNQGQSS